MTHDFTYHAGKVKCRNSQKRKALMFPRSRIPRTPAWPRTSRWPCAALLGVCMLPQTASAGLGEPETAVATDAERLAGSLKSMDRSAYRLHEIQLPSGTALREYADSSGLVFAVAWSGPSIPDLRQALARYFEPYAAAAEANRSGHRHLEIRQDRLVVQSNGHMRAFTGRAYLPQAVPVGVSLDEIR